MVKTMIVNPKAPTDELMSQLAMRISEADAIFAENMEEVKDLALWGAVHLVREAHQIAEALDAKLAKQ